MRQWERSDKRDESLNENMVLLKNIGLSSFIGECGPANYNIDIVIVTCSTSTISIHHADAYDAVYTFFLFQARASTSAGVGLRHKRMLKDGRSSSHLCAGTKKNMGTATFQLEQREN